MPQALDFSSNVYLAVSLTETSLYKTTPIQLGTPFTSVNINDLGNVGALPDVKLLSVPKDDWNNVGEDILRALKDDKVNVLRVEQQVPKQRNKRPGDEL